MVPMSNKANTTRINIKGYSGCAVDIITEGDKTFVRKSIFKPEYHYRLLRQAGKQQKFHYCNFYTGVRVPEVYTTGHTENSAYFDMEYFHSLDYIEKFQSIGKAELDKILDTLFCFIDSNITQSSTQIISKSVLVHKLDEIYAKVPYDNKTLIIEMIPERMELPIGYCHGDLTFSNILFHDDSVVLIDFLDSFIETPLIDICKLRQDTRYNWSEQLCTRKYNKVKLQLVLNYIDERIEAKFTRYPFFQYYSIFQIVNLLRILPYATNDGEINCKLQSHIYNILKNDLQRFNPCSR